MATFGYTSIGGSSNEGNWNSIYSCKFAAPEDGTLTELHFYGFSYSSATATLCVHSDNAGAPNALLASGNYTFSGGAQWYNVVGLSLAISNGVNYWLGNSVASQTNGVYYDAGASNQTAYQNSTGGSPPNPFSPTGYQNWKMSIYATYTPSGGGAPMGAISGGHYGTHINKKIKGGWANINKGFPQGLIGRC